MHVTLVGMSNTGKSRLANRLARECGFTKLGCDLLIEQKLAPELILGGHAGTRGLARWMGQPFDPHYAENSRKYLACEKEVMQEAIEKLRAPSEKPVVIDTTGSVIYTGDDIIGSLKSLTRVIYLEASPEHGEKLFERYLAEPKPVFWADAYQPRPGETRQEALKRCYPELLNDRTRRYKEMAHVTVPFESLEGNASLETLIEAR